MSTSLVDVNQTWQNLVSGPVSTFAIEALTHKQYYQLVVAQPTANARGHVLNPAKGVSVELTGTDNLWVRTANTVDDQMAITN